MPQPSSRLRLIVPLVVGALALVIILLVATGEGGSNKVDTSAHLKKPAATTAAAPLVTEDVPAATTEQEKAPASPAKAAETTEPSEATTKAEAEAEATTKAEAEAAPAKQTSTEHLHIQVHPYSVDEPLQTIGDLDDPDQWSMQLVFTREGAGLTRIPFSNIWQTAASRRQALMYFSAKAAGDTTGYSLPPESERYILLNEQMITWNDPEGDLQQRLVSILSANRVVINGDVLDLTRGDHWIQPSPGVFKATVLNEDEEPVARLHRRWELGSGYDITLEQSFENLGSEPMTISWAQYGPPSLIPDRSRYMDRRRFRFGYEYPESFDPNHVADVIAGGDMVLELTDASDEGENFWPNELSQAEGFTLSWFASTNRYFGLAVHPVLGADGQGTRSLAPLVQTIGKWVQSSDQSRVIFSTLRSPDIEVAGGSHA